MSDGDTASRQRRPENVKYPDVEREAKNEAECKTGRSEQYAVCFHDACEVKGVLRVRDK